jgi:CheY-like chemotaxis protein/anti-sigma regulatory factor (Ser/Thr protein kinase)
MAHVLVVEDSRTQALAIQLLLEDAGFTVDVAGNGREALALLGQSRIAGTDSTCPDVVLTDLEMPEVNGLRLVETVRQQFSDLPVVLMTAVGSEEIAVQALQRGAASYIPKRILETDIASTLHNVLAVVQAGRDQARLMECLTHTEMRFVLDNNTALVPALIGHLDQQIRCIQRSDTNELMRVGVALHEAILNAIYHGNLEVSSELRQESEKHFHQIVNERRRQPPYRDRRVHVRATLGRDQTVYVVQDEGPGFDPRALPDPADPANLDRIGGRGLMLIRTFMDQVKHNATGNEITMIKRVGRAER